MEQKTITLAGGCFWCVEHDLRALPGVLGVVSGYAANDDIDLVPSYGNHVGFREAVQVAYDPSQISFKKIVQFFLDHIDPTDDGGQFYDRGESYKTAIYFANDAESVVAHSLLQELDGSHIYDKPIVVDVLPLIRFYNAEDYHQDYADKNPEHYAQYRNASGRAEFVGRTCQIRDERRIPWKD